MATQTITLGNASDTWVDSRYPAKNYAGTSRLGLASGDAYAFLYFAVPFPKGVTITSATLSVWTSEAWGSGSHTLTAQRVASKFQTSKVTWQNRPGVTGTSSTATQTANAAGTRWDVDVKAIMQAVAAGGAWYGIRLAISTTTLRKLRSAGASAQRPRLTVSWAENPQKPSVLSPSGGKVVSSNVPTLTTDFVDKVGATKIGGIWVQTSATTSFAAPSWDSGWKSVSEPALPLAEQAGYVPAAAGVPVYWRVKTRDTAGFESPWSDTASFVYKGLPSLTINNPAAAPGNVVLDSTPPISWTLGATQRAYQVVLRKKGNSSTLWDSGVVTSTDNSATPPAGKITDTTGATVYTVTVRAWDTETRVQTPDALPYAEQSRDFTLSSTSSVVGPTSLTVAQSGNAGEMKLTWTRGTMPDGWEVVRNGKVVLSADGNDLFVSGTTYSWTDREARPKTANTWRVRAKTAGVGASNPSNQVTATYQLPGLWLIDPDDPSTDLFLARTGGSSFELAEDAAVLTPLGASDPIRVSQAQRGYEGRVEGVLLDGQYGVSLATWLDRLRRLRNASNERGQVLVLKVGDNALRVVVGGMTARATGDSTPGSREVAFDYWQVDSDAYFGRA